MLSLGEIVILLTKCINLLSECPIITTEEVQAAARLAHRGKAAVEDGELMKISCLAGNFYINYWQSYLMLSYSFLSRQ